MKRQIVNAAMVIILVAGVSSWAGGACCAKSAKAAWQGSGAQAMSQPAPDEARAQTRCPVMDGAVNKSHYADYKGKRVYFCCGACVEAFNKDPEKYMKKLADEGVQIENTPATE